jgi:hypothetical protein
VGDHVFLAVFCLFAQRPDTHSQVLEKFSLICHALFLSVASLKYHVLFSTWYIWYIGGRADNMNNALNPDFYLSSPCPSCPIPWPQTPEEAHAITVMYLVTWTTGLIFLLWKDRDSFRVTLVVFRHLFRRSIRTIRQALPNAAQEGKAVQPQPCNQREEQ